MATNIQYFTLQADDATAPGTLIENRIRLGDDLDLSSFLQFTPADPTTIPPTPASYSLNADVLGANGAFKATSDPVGAAQTLTPANSPVSLNFATPQFNTGSFTVTPADDTVVPPIPFTVAPDVAGVYQVHAQISVSGVADPLTDATFTLLVDGAPIVGGEKTILGLPNQDVVDLQQLANLAVGQVVEVQVALVNGAGPVIFDLSTLDLVYEAAAVAP